MTRSIARFLVAAAILSATAGTLRASTVDAGPRRIDVVMEARMGEFAPQVIYARQGDTVHVTIRAMDTAHGFKVQGRDDVDVLLMPGQTVEVTFVVDWEGGREWYCTFSCGSQHGTMTGMIVALPSEQD